MNSTSDTVTQEWMEAFRPTEKYYTTTGYGNTVLISDKPRPMRPPEPPTVWGRSTEHEATFLDGLVAGAGVVIMAILITYVIIIL